MTDDEDGYAASFRVMRQNGDEALADALERAVIRADGSDEPMKITLTLAVDERIALRRYARDIGEDLDAAAHIGLREFLIGIGMLELPESDNDNDE